jgi:hypothetical protein
MDWLSNVGSSHQGGDPIVARATHENLAAFSVPREVAIRVNADFSLRPDIHVPGVSRELPFLRGRERKRREPARFSRHDRNYTLTSGGRQLTCRAVSTARPKEIRSSMRVFRSPRGGLLIEMRSMKTFSTVVLGKLHPPLGVSCLPFLSDG